MKPGPDGYNQRRHPRSEIAATAIVLTLTRYAGTYLVRNLSAGGALLVGDSLLHVGERIRILLQIHGTSPMSLVGEVVRHESRTEGERLFAITFGDVPAAVEDTIQQAVLRTLENVRGKQQCATVLVLDTSLESRLALERELQSLGHEAVSASTPLEAMSRLYSGQPRIETVIVDARLGHADGLEFLAFLADDHPHIRRVLMSGDFRTAHLILAKRAKQPHAFLAKPWDRETLTRALAP